MSFWEPLGKMKVMQIRQRETQIHQGAITHEVCCLAAQYIYFLLLFQVSAEAYEWPATSPLWTAVAYAAFDIALDPDSKEGKKKEVCIQ